MERDRDMQARPSYNAKHFHVFLLVPTPTFVPTCHRRITEVFIGNRLHVGSSLRISASDELFSFYRVRSRPPLGNTRGARAQGGRSYIFSPFLGKNNHSMKGQPFASREQELQIELISIHYDYCSLNGLTWIS